ncbi:MAG: hypothetical protein ACRDQU_09160 [Pseudonocardiaceae bacterium]
MNRSLTVGADLPQRSPRRVARWALSPADCEVHLLARDGEAGTDCASEFAISGTSALTARCGASLAAAAIQHDQPPPGPPCEGCSRIYLEEFFRHAGADLGVSR